MANGNSASPSRFSTTHTIFFLQPCRWSDILSMLTGYVPHTLVARLVLAVHGSSTAPPRLPEFWALAIRSTLAGKVRPSWQLSDVRRISTMGTSRLKSDHFFFLSFFGHVRQLYPHILPSRGEYFLLPPAGFSIPRQLLANVSWPEGNSQNLIHKGVRGW